MSKTITGCAGAGDLIWLMQKLINQPDKFHWRIPGGEPRRGHQVFELLPQLVESFAWADGLGYAKIKAKGYRGKWSNSPNQMYLEANTWLEAGKRIEGFLPDLPTSFVLPWVTGEYERDKAAYLTPRGRFIGIYTSAYQKDDRWRGWTAKQWADFCEMMGEGITFVVIGAKWDTNMSDEVMKEFKDRNIPYINTVGQPLGVVIEIMKRLELLVGFPSGLSILNETLNAGKTLMWYPAHLEKMINTWASPERIENSSYKGCVWCEPEKIIEWMKEHWKDIL